MLIVLQACVWHRLAVCSAHGHAGSIASPGGGPLPFWVCSIIIIATVATVAATVATEAIAAI